MNHLPGELLLTLCKVIGGTGRSVLLASLAGIGLTLSRAARRDSSSDLPPDIPPRPKSPVQARFSLSRAHQSIQKLVRVDRPEINRGRLSERNFSAPFLSAAPIRRIRDLALVSGLPGVGKTELVDRLKSSKGELARQFGYKPGDTWQTLTALELEKGTGVKCRETSAAVQHLQAYEARPAGL